MLGDTIVALATPRGFAPRAVIRLSGPRAGAIAAAVFRSADLRPFPPPAAAALAGRVVIGPRGESVEAAAWCFRAPHSSTGEDVVELHLPGSPLLCGLVQDVLAGAGARVAEPGEFTRRGFLAGKIDLSRAEAVLELTRARTAAERRAALSILEGGLERRVAEVRDLVLEALVPLELSLDFSDQDIEIVMPRELSRLLDRLGTMLEELASGTTATAPALTAFRVVLEGPANAGKSSLFNRLLGRDAAIVAPSPGTTRDVLTGEIEEGGVRLLVVDTAGRGVVTGEADRQAHAQRERRLREADLVLEVRDVRTAASGRRPPRPGRLRALTHADLAGGGPALAPGEMLVSSVTGAGVDGLRARLSAALSSARGHRPGAPLAVNARHAAGFLGAHAAVQRATDALDRGAGPELIASDLRDALAGVLALTGQDAPQAVLDRIFAGFCIGK